MSSLLVSYYNIIICHYPSPIKPSLPPSIIKTPYLKVLKDKVKLPNGTTKSFYVLDRYSPFSIIVPLVDKHTTILVGQYRYPAKYYSWEFPMGQVKGTSPLQMAKIELKQETGITAKTWHQIGHFFIANGHCSQGAFVFTAANLTLGKPQPEPNEFLKIKQVKLDQVSRMIKSGRILDGPTITAYHFFKLQQNSL